MYFHCLLSHLASTQPIRDRNHTSVTEARLSKNVIRILSETYQNTARIPSECYQKYSSHCFSTEDFESSDLLISWCPYFLRDTIPLYRTLSTGAPFAFSPLRVSLFSPHRPSHPSYLRQRPFRFPFSPASTISLCITEEIRRGCTTDERVAEGRSRRHDSD